MTGVLITGGTGKTGSVLAELLRGSGVPVRVASRVPPADAPDAVRFDWSDPATHPAALHGMDGSIWCLRWTPRIRCRWSNRSWSRLNASAYAEWCSSAPPSCCRVPTARWNWPRGCGPARLVVLRPSGFMQNFLAPHPLGERIRRRGEIRTAAGSGRVGWIDARDIAAVAAVLLTEPGGHRDDRRDYLLTGPKALNYQDAAQAITLRTGRPIRVVPVGVAEQADAYRASGMPDAFATALAAVDAGLRTGWDDQVSTAVLDLTGRPPRTFAEFVQDHALHWTDPRGTR